MNRAIGAVGAAVLAFGLGGAAGADGDKDALAIVAKAVRAVGGQDKVGALKAMTWKAKGTITFGDADNPFTSETTVQDLDHFRREFEGEFGGNKFKGVTVVSGDKGWRKFGDNVMELDKDALANEKRTMYLHVVANTLVPLRGKHFKVEAAPAEKLDKPAVVVKATGPDGKDFKLYFDKDSGLLVKQVAKVIGFMGDEYTQSTTFGNYQDKAGVKVATKIVSTRNGEKFLDQEITDFRSLAKVDPKKFAEPE
jgi:hypothetical protein